MTLLHFILNVVGLLLWVNWRGMGFKEYVPYRSTLVHTLKSAEPRRPGRWRYLAGLALLLIVRAWLYQTIGSALHWVPVIDLQVLTLPFRSDLPWRMLLFSWLSFGLAWTVFHLALLLLSMANRAVPDTQPVQHLVRLHLGPVARWPIALQLLLPFLCCALAWLPLQPLLTRAGLLPAGAAMSLVAEQGVVIGLAVFLALPPIIIALLLLYLLNSYVYLGRSPFLDFASLAGRNLQKPVSSLPLRLGRVDFAPVVAAGLVWFSAVFFERGLVALFNRLPL